MTAAPGHRQAAEAVAGRAARQPAEGRRPMPSWPPAACSAYRGWTRLRRVLLRWQAPQPPGREPGSLRFGRLDPPGIPPGNPPAFPPPQMAGATHPRLPVLLLVRSPAGGQSAAKTAADWPPWGSGAAAPSGALRAIDSSTRSAILADLRPAPPAAAFRCRTASPPKGVGRHEGRACPGGVGGCVGTTRAPAPLAGRWSWPPLGRRPGPTARDLAALRFVGEQYAVRLDVATVLLTRLSTTGPERGVSSSRRAVREQLGRWEAGRLGRAAPPARAHLGDPDSGRAAPVRAGLRGVVAGPRPARSPPRRRGGAAAP